MLALYNLYPSKISYSLVTFFSLSVLISFFRQIWSQVHTLRIILAHDHPLPPRLFLFEEPSVKVTSQIALTVFYDVIAKMTTFSLVNGQSYVKLIEGFVFDVLSLKYFLY